MHDTIHTNLTIRNSSQPMLTGQWVYLKILISSSVIFFCNYCMRRPTMQSPILPLRVQLSFSKCIVHVWTYVFHSACVYLLLAPSMMQSMLTLQSACFLCHTFKRNKTIKLRQHPGNTAAYWALICVRVSCITGIVC